MFVKRAILENDFQSYLKLFLRSYSSNLINPPCTFKIKKGWADDLVVLNIFFKTFKFLLNN